MAVGSNFLLSMVEDALSGLPLKAMLVKPTYEPDGEQTRADLTAVAAEVVDPGYTSGGVALTSVAISYDATDDRVEVTADNPAWGPFSTSVGVGGVVIYHDTGTASTSTIICMDLSDEGTTSPGQQLVYVIDPGAGFLQVASGS